MNFGDLPTWVAAIGTVGALVAALIQINVERSRRHAQEANDRAERRLAQARLVAAFLGSEETRGRPGPGDTDLPRRRSGDGERTPIYVVNGSTEPFTSQLSGSWLSKGPLREQWNSGSMRVGVASIQQKRTVQSRSQPPAFCLLVSPWSGFRERAGRLTFRDDLLRKWRLPTALVFIG